jgi:succinate dehydrogenase/fumarate reductase flavoprotein subunit
LVIGGGIAGCCTACSAAENGLKVKLVEKTEGLGLRTYVFGASNSRMMEQQDSTVDKAFAQEEWNRTCGNRANEKLVTKFMDASPDAINWVLDKADANGALTVLSGNHAIKSKTYPEAQCAHMVLSMIDGVMQPDINAVGNWMRADAEARGTEFIFSSPAVQLVQDGAKVVGAICETEEGYVRYSASKAVVLATGDIGGNLDMVEAYAPIAAPLVENGRNIYFPIGANTGDGLKMGLWVGAQLPNLPLPTMMHPQQYCQMSPGCFPAVNYEGERFFNEGIWMQGRTLNIMKQTDYSCYWILDSNWHDYYLESLEAGGGGVFWDGFEDKDAAMGQIQGYIDSKIAWQADTLEDLATAMDVDPATFRGTMDRYNGFCAAGEDADFRKPVEQLKPAKDGPFIGLKVGASLLTVPGSLKVNVDSQVLNKDGGVIEGLYAVGNVQGELFANDYPLYIVGCSHGRCMTFGYELGKYLKA